MHRRLLGVGVAAVAIGVVGAALINQKSMSGAPGVGLRPAYGPAETYRQGFSAVRNRRPVAAVGAIVNHHLVAADLIADTLAQIDWSLIDRVVLVSPNHFLAGRGTFLGSRSDWITPFGRLRADRRAADELAAAAELRFDDEALIHEHGITNILPFLTALDPQIRIVPLVVRDQAPFRHLAAMRQALDRLADGRTLFLGSFDFSHYQTLAVATAHDETSLAVLARLDEAATDGLDVDSPRGLALLLGTVRAAGADRFQLMHRGNSALYLGRPQATETTSYLTGVFTLRRQRAYTDSVMIHR